MTSKTNHDPAYGRCCPCDICQAEALASLMVSRAQSAAQAALWHPRSRKLALARAEAEQDRERALAALRAARAA